VGGRYPVEHVHVMEFRQINLSDVTPALARP
jgi:hypothetical protein